MTAPTHVLSAGGGPAALEAAPAVQRLAAERVRHKISGHELSPYLESHAAALRS